jgi:hypothetical protein
VTTGRCERVFNRANEKLKDVQGNIKHLKTMEKNLKNLVKECQLRKNHEACHIIEGMESES